MIPQEYIYELLQRNEITDVVQSYMQLRHRGRTHTGLCPFHNEKTPSFVVYPETQSFYCFGCGEGGDVIGFTKKINNIDYVEAVKQLAARCGMSLPQENDSAGRMRQRITGLNKDAARFFHEQLNTENGAVARKYWRARGLSDSTIRRFGLGYAPNSYDETYNALTKIGYTDDELLAAGLMRKSEKGNYYDVFHNRVMVPIFDLRGNVIAFGGRNLGDEKPKYINSPETVLYKKSNAIFALNIAKKSADKKYILCEGYMDVIALHQAGFTSAVAACGTALTSQQVKLLSDYADEVVLCYDSDEAGQKATNRAIELLSSSAVKISVLSIPDAKDPDEFIKRFGKERFEMLINGSSNAIEYELLRAKSKYDIASADGRLNYIKDAIKVLAGKITATERDVYAGRLAEETDIAKTAILNQLDSAIRTRARLAGKERERRLLDEGVGGRISVPYSKGGAAAKGVVFAEQQLVAAIIKYPEYIDIAALKLTAQQFISDDMREAYELLLLRKNEKQYIDLAQLSLSLKESTRLILSKILAQNHEILIGKSDVEIYIKKIEESTPQSARAGEKTPQELMEYVQRLKEKKI